MNALSFTLTLVSIYSSNCRIEQKPTSTQNNAGAISLNSKLYEYPSFCVIAHIACVQSRPFRRSHYILQWKQTSCQWNDCTHAGEVTSYTDFCPGSFTLTPLIAFSPWCNWMRCYNIHFSCPLLRKMFTLHKPGRWVCYTNTMLHVMLRLLLADITCKNNLGTQVSDSEVTWLRFVKCTSSY